MEKIKLYVDELPSQCLYCCFAYDGLCQASESKFNYCGENCRRSDCPLIDVKTHDQELVKEMCEKIRERYNLENKPITDAFGDTQYGYVMVSAKDLKQFLDQIQKEFKK